MYYNFCALGDLHFKEDSNQNSFIFNKIESLVSAIKGHFSFVSRRKKIIFLINGDIASTGKQSEYEHAKLFFEKLRNELKDNFDVDFIFAPGNHDYDKYGEDHFENFYKFINQFDSQNFDVIMDRCACVYQIKSKYGKKINLITLNPYIDCPSVEEFYLSKIDSKYLDDNLDISSQDYNIVLSHISESWYDKNNENNYVFLKKQVFGIFSHEHLKGKITTINCNNHDSKFMSLNCFSESDRKNESGFVIFTINNENSTLKYKFYEYDKDNHIYSGQEESELRLSKSVRIKDAFISIYEDKLNSFLNEDFIFYSNNTAASFHKLYVDQTLYEESVYEIDYDRNNKVELEYIVDNCKNFIVYGHKECGKTTFAKKMYLEFYKSGKIPIYIEGKPRLTEEYIKQTIRSTAKNMYDASYEFIIQNTSKIVLIIDNFDCNSDNITLISECAKYGSFVLITDVITGEDWNNLSHFRLFKLAGFGNADRYKLITNWVDFEHAELSEIEKNKYYNSLDHLFRKMKNHANSLNPKLILILLYSSKEDKKIQIDSSKIVYYTYIINKYLYDISSKTNLNSSIIKDYYTELAYYIHKNDNYNISDFNGKFLNEFSITSDDIKKILKYDNLYSCGKKEFSYEFIYAFFLANYFIENIANNSEIEEEMIRIVDSQCFLPLYSSTVLFYLYGSKNPKIIKECIEMADKLFVDVKEGNFDDDIKVLNSFIKDVRINKNKSGKVKDNKLASYKKLDEAIRREDVIENEQKELSEKGKLIKLSYALDEIFSNYVNVINKTKDKHELITKVFHMGMRRVKLCADDSLKEFIGYLKKLEENPGDDQMKNVEYFFNFVIFVLVYQVELVAESVASLKDINQLENIIEPKKSSLRRLIFNKLNLFFARENSILDLDYLTSSKNKFMKEENHICYGTLMFDVKYEIDYVGSYNTVLTQKLFQSINSELLSKKNTENIVEEINRRKSRKKILTSYREKEKKYSNN